MLIPQILFSNLLKDFNKRKSVYHIIYPILGINIFLSFLTDSYYFFLIVTISYFFSLDAVALEDENIICDFSKFFYIPKSKLHILNIYFKYRILHSLLFSLIPTVIILSFCIYIFKEIEYNLEDFNQKTLFYSLFEVWLFYIIMTSTIFIEGRRNIIVKNIIKSLSYPFYIGLLFVQLHFSQAFTLKLNTFNSEFFSGFLGLIIILFFVFLKSFIKVQNGKEI